MHAHLLACLHSAQLLHSYIVFDLLPREGCHPQWAADQLKQQRLERYLSD